MGGISPASTGMNPNQLKIALTFEVSAIFLFFFPYEITR
jgi:hypothetical protein